MAYNCKKCGKGNIDHDYTYPYHDIYTCKDCGHAWHARIDDCCRRPFPIVTILRYDPSRFSLYHQCLNCGGAYKTKHLKAKIYNKEIRAEFNEWRFDEWKKYRNEESDQIYEGIKYTNYTLSKTYKYHQYLFSDEWKEKRDKVMDRDNHLCQCCKTAKAEDVHHLTYDNLFNEPLEDLLALCRLCHFNTHKKTSGKQQSIN